jgi:photosystem II stability/assembly factor-like uncharacterized protein
LEDRRIGKLNPDAEKGSPVATDESRRLAMFSPRLMLKLNLCLGTLLAASSLQAIAQQPRTSPRTHTASPSQAAASSSAPQAKAIWEPMNYPDDVLLEDVFFVNQQVGWVAGKGTGGFIMHTADDGKNWEMQVGDPHSNDAEINHMHFLDAVHGWAVQGDQLIRTTDGRTWQTIGPFAPNNPLAEYRFISLQDGFEAAGYYSGSSIFATHDGGRSWKAVYQCATTLQVNGLSRDVSCFINDITFPSAQIGYAVGGAFDGSWAAIVKTTDGGASWRVIFATTDLASVSTAFFTDENNGVIRLHDKRVFITADGGQSWQGAAGSAEATIKFADPSVGWSCVLQYGPACSYTVDGGKTWNSRSFNFPADMYGYSAPRRDQVFVVGDHGMMYRYRIVPASYTAPGIVDAPMVPAYGGALNDQLDQMRTHCKELQAKLGAAASQFYLQPQARFPAAHLVTVSYETNDAEPQDFTQDTSAQAAFAAPASPAMQNCCATQLQGLQTSVSSFSQQVPVFSGQFKNLNLLFVGMNMLSNLLTQAHSIQAAFVALKQAPNLQAAATALQNLTTQVEGTSQTLSTGFQNLTLSGAQSANTITNMAGSPDPGTTPATPGANSTAPANGAAGTQPQNSTTSNAVNKAAQKAKQKLKSLIPF